MKPTRVYLELGRPFTLVAPALGFVSGGLTAIGAAPPEPWLPSLLTYPLIGSLMAAVLNAGNNALNQIYDLDIDRINKPKRPIPSGRLTINEAWGFAVVTYALSLVLAWLVAAEERHECLWIVLVAVVCTFIYSMPPFRTMGAEPWYIGAIFGLFLLGATTTKDFADMEGDRLGGYRTLPIQYGVRRAAWMISPSFVVPFVMINVGSAMGILTGSSILLQALGLFMTAYGLCVCYLMLRRPEELAVEENHVLWAHMYRMMFVVQIGFAVAYLA